MLIPTDLSNPFTFLYALPAHIFAIFASVLMSRRQKKKQSVQDKTETEANK